MPNQSHAVAISASMILGATPAWACPLCLSETGERVRAGILGDDFGYNLFATFLPFPVFLAIVALIRFGWPWAKDRNGQGPSPDAGDAKQP